MAMVASTAPKPHAGSCCTSHHRIPGRPTRAACSQQPRHPRARLGSARYPRAQHGRPWRRGTMQGHVGCSPSAAVRPLSASAPSIRTQQRPISIACRAYSLDRIASSSPLAVAAKLVCHRAEHRQGPGRKRPALEQRSKLDSRSAAELEMVWSLSLGRGEGPHRAPPGPALLALTPPTHAAITIFSRPNRLQGLHEIYPLSSALGRRARARAWKAYSLYSFQPR
jgi:hypothetical protein